MPECRVEWEIVKDCSNTGLLAQQITCNYTTYTGWRTAKEASTSSASTNATTTENTAETSHITEEGFNAEVTHKISADVKKVKGEYTGKLGYDLKVRILRLTNQ